MLFTNKFNLLLISLILILSGCLKKKESTPVVETLSAYSVGSSNFGRVPLGETRYAGIKIVNNTSKIQTITYPSFLSPFSIYIPNSTCSNYLQAGSSCIIGVQFSPLVRNSFSANVNVLGYSIDFSGQGTSSGVLNASPLTWTINSEAGQQTTQTFTLYNDGDQNIPFPSLSNMSDVLISHNNCNTSIAPGTSCTIDVTFQRTVSGTFTDTLRFLSSSSVFSDVSVNSTVTPSSPDGVITFTGVPSSIIANGSDEYTFTGSVPDIFSNPVVNGTVVNLTGTNINFPDGNTATVTNGKFSIKVRSTNIKTATYVYASSGNAYGQVQLRIASGEPCGTIGVQSFNNTLKANGTSSLTVTTNQVLDCDGNVVDDGKLVYFQNTGSGTLKVSSGTTYNGRVSLTITSPISTGSDSIQFLSSPIYSGASIIGYNATSSIYPVYYSAGYPSGTFAFNCTRSNIYLETSSDSFLSTVDRTTCSIGPIYDVNMNLVGAGYGVNVNILNGKRCSDSSVNFITNTNSSSIATFDLCGNNSRGLIEMEAISSGTSVFKNIYASESLIKKYEPYTDVFSLYRGYGPSIFSASNLDILPPGITGSKLQKYRGDLNALVDNDTEHLGSITYSSDAQTLSYSFPRMLGSDCLQNVDYQVQILPCFYYVMSGSTYYYGSTSTYNIGYDGQLNILNLDTMDRKLGSSTAHGSYQNIFSNQFYNPASDSYQTIGGLYYSGSTSFDTYVNHVYSQVVYPSTFKTQYDSMIYRQGSSSLPFMMSNTSTVKGSTYLFGGSDIDGVLSRDLYVASRDINETLGISIKKINVSPDAIYGDIPQMVSSGMYYDEETNYLYIVGGKKRISGTWSNNDQVWKVKLSGTSFTWERVCTSCGLPQTSITSWSSYATFPISTSANTPITFDGLTSNSSSLKIFKNTDGKIILFIENGLVYELNLSSGGTTQRTDSTALAFLANSNMYTINSLTGRKFSFQRGSKTATDSKINFFETAKGTKAYFVSKFQLNDNAKESALRLKVLISGFAWAKDTSTSEDYGLNTYIYNNSTSQWELLGTTLATNELDSFSNSTTYELTINPENYVNNSDQVFIMNTAKGTPSCYSTSDCSASGISNLKINYIEVSGEF